jgi:hypothetical protein
MEKTRSGLEAAMDKCGIDHPEPGDGGPETAPSAGTVTLTPATPRGA